MCGRYVLTRQHAAQIARAAAAIVPEASLPASRFNIPPGGRIPVIRNQTDRDSRELTNLHWGITPAWAGPSGRPVTNARAESVAEKPTFRDAFRRRRCLIPVSAFYEWTTTGGPRQPWAFLQADGEPFCLGGIWDDDHCVVVTTAANTVMSPIHHRMPVILTTPDDFTAWLNPQMELPESSRRLSTLLAPASPELVQAQRVSSRINNVRNDDEGCLAEATHPTDDQLGFGW